MDSDNCTNPLGSRLIPYLKEIEYKIKTIWVERDKERMEKYNSKIHCMWFLKFV